MKIAIPDLGETFRFQQIAGGNAGGEASGRATSGEFAITPGVFILNRNEKFDRATLPKRFGNVGLDEYHAPAAQPPSPPHVEPRIPSDIVAGAPATFAARVVTADAPDDVLLFIRPAGTARFRKHAMKRTGGYGYAVMLDGDNALKEGLFECCISVVTKEATLTVPGQIARKPDDWDFYGTTFSTALVTPLRAPRKLFTPARDVPKLAFSRIGDGGRRGIFRTVAGRSAGEAAFHLEMPIMNGWSPKDYTASLTIKDRIVSLAGAVAEAKSLTLHLRALGEKQVLHVTFAERDGASWSAEVRPGREWAEVSIPLTAFKPARGVMLPQGFPGDWNYWIDMPAGRGGDGDALRPRDIERLQFSVRTPPGEKVVADPYGFEIESATLDFTTTPAGTDAATRPAAAVTPALRNRVAQLSRVPLIKQVNSPSAGG
jgi:hypothetical protein